MRITLTVLLCLLAGVTTWLCGIATLSLALLASVAFSALISIPFLVQLLRQNEPAAIDEEQQVLSLVLVREGDQYSRLLVKPEFFSARQLRLKGDCDRLSPESLPEERGDVRASSAKVLSALTELSDALLRANSHDLDRLRHHELHNREGFLECLISSFHQAQLYFLHERYATALVLANRLKRDFEIVIEGPINRS